MDIRQQYLLVGVDILQDGLDHHSVVAFVVKFARRQLRYSIKMEVALHVRLRL